MKLSNFGFEFCPDYSSDDSDSYESINYDEHTNSGSESESESEFKDFSYV